MEEQPGSGTVTKVAAVVVVALACVLAAGIVLGIGLSKGDGSLSDPVVIDAAIANVDIWNYKFFPDNLVVRPGTRVVWTNFDPSPHDATADDDSWSTPLLQQGREFTMGFDEPGVYAYYCTVHPFMKGRIVVS